MKALNPLIARCLSAALVALTSSIATNNLQAGERVGDFALIDHLGAFHKMSWYDDNNAIVIVPLANGVSDSAGIVSKFTQLRDQYKDRQVAFFMLNPGLQSDRQAVQQEAQSLAIDLPILMDDTHLVTEMLGVTRLDEAVVYDPKNFEIVYRGPMQEQLQDSLDQLLRAEVAELTIVAGSGREINYSTPQRQQQASYQNDIAPLIAENCASCHREGGIAPFAMDSHLAVQGWSPMIKEVIMTKRMPPGQIDNKVGLKVADAMNLRDEEMQMLVHWINNGSPVDGNNDPLAQLQWPQSKWSYGEPDKIVQVPPQTIPATGVVEYMNVPIELNLEEDVWIRGSEVVPGDSSVLHHIITTVIPPEGVPGPEEMFASLLQNMPAEKAQALQQKLMAAALAGEEIDINDIFSELGEDADLSLFVGASTDPDMAAIAGYAPGAPGGLYPEGVGGILKAGSRLNLQMHYTTTGKEAVDATEIGIYYYPKGEIPKERMAVGVANNFMINIPAQAKDYEMTTGIVVTRDAYLYSLMPHMHFRGKRMQFSAQYPDGSEELLLSVPDYSFNWQLIHRLEEPKFLPQGTRIVATGAFDNSSQNPYNPDPESAVHWGEQSWDEMFMGFFDWKYSDQSGSD